MKTLSLIIVTLFGIGMSAQAQDKVRADRGTVGMATVFLKYEEQAHEKQGGSDVTVWYQKPGETNFYPKMVWRGGSGFVVLHNSRKYLVTAKHVAQILPPDTEILLHTDSGEAHDTLGSLERGLPFARWFMHPIADIAVHPFELRNDIRASVANLLESCFQPEDQPLKPFQVVLILGYPFGIGTQQILTPVGKSAAIGSWMTTINDPGMPTDLQFILLDQPIAQGYSGSPVFAEYEPGNSIVVMPGYTPPLWLIGVVSGTYSDESGGKLGMVVPLKYLRDIFASQDFLDYEKAISK